MCVISVDTDLKTPNVSSPVSFIEKRLLEQDHNLIILQWLWLDIINDKCFYATVTIEKCHFYYFENCLKSKISH